MSTHVREVEAVALARRTDASEPERKLGGADRDIDVDDVAEVEVHVLEEEVEVRAGHERLLEIGTGDALHLRLPAVLEAAHDGDAQRLALTQAGNTRIAEVDEQAHAAPALIQLEVGRVGVARGTE